jgi:hypothetical protein
MLAWPSFWLLKVGASKKWSSATNCYSHSRQKAFAKIFLSECRSRSRSPLNVYPDPNTGGCYLKFSRKPSREQKIFAKTFAKTKIFAKTNFAKISRKWKKGYSFQPYRDSTSINSDKQMATTYIHRPQHPECDKWTEAASVQWQP